VIDQVKRVLCERDSGQQIVRDDSFAGLDKIEVRPTGMTGIVMSAPEVEVFHDSFKATKRAG
jgi:hypothetical protein